MKNSDKKWIEDMLYISYRLLSIDECLKNLYVFLALYMHVSYVSIHMYSKNEIKKISLYSPHESMFTTPDRVEIPDETLKEIILDKGSAGTWRSGRICRGDAENSYYKVFSRLHPEGGASIILPLDYGDVFDNVRYLGIYSIDENAYCEEDLTLCEEVSRPLRAAIVEILQRQDGTSAGVSRFGFSASRQSGSFSSDLAGNGPSGKFHSLDEHISQYIRRVIRHTNGRISGKNGAAALLGLPPTTLWSKMRKLKISARA